MTANTMQRAAPVTQPDRISSLDITRGAAVLGILLMNIWSLAWPRKAFDYPTMLEGLSGASLATWTVVHTFFEGTQRTLFSLLFGAGALMIMTRLADHPRGGRIYYRRIGLLILFGCVNAYIFLWPADILFAYGLCGLLLYPLRKRSNTILIVLALTIMCVQAAMHFSDLSSVSALKRHYTEIMQSSTLPTKDEEVIVADWKAALAKARPAFDDPEFQENVRIMQQGTPFEVITNQVSTSVFMQAFVTPIVFVPDALAAMLIGMVLYRLGLLTLQRGPGFLKRMAMISYGIGLPVSLWETYIIAANDFDPVALATALLTYDIGRFGMAFGHLSLLLLLCHSAKGAWLKKPLQAVGQMALTNYLGQSILGALLFYSFGLGLYGKLAGYELYYAVAGMWLFQCLFSMAWLARYRFGPFEWLWRSLTYGARQPLKRSSTPIAARSPSA